MCIFGKCLRISCFLMVLLLASISTAQSQDIFREVSQVKSDLSSLKSEVNNLRNLVLEMRSVVLEQAMDCGPTAPREVQVKNRKKEEKQPQPVNEEEITKIACRVVGQFFEEADSALRSRDPSTATPKMKKAFQKMTSALREYSRTHRVSKLLRIYDGLAWDTYTAVELRQSTSGNEDFLKALNRHKQKYIDTCP